MRAQGRIVVYAGAMASGKSAALIEACARERHEGRGLLVLAASTSRDNGETIASRDGRVLPAESIGSIDELVARTRERRPESVAVDEAQFLGDGLAEALEELLVEGRFRFFIALLNLDFAARPFPGAGDLLSIADEVHKLHATCRCCGGAASRSQRLIAGRPAPRSAPLVAIEDDAIDYEPRCRACYEPPAG